MFVFLFIDMPSMSKFFGNGILTGLKNLFEYIVKFFATVSDSLHQFYDTINEINTYVIMWTNAFTGQGDVKLPVFASIGAYRYLVGEGAFYITYIVILSGCLFTIFRLVYILYRLFEKLQDKILNKNGKTVSGLLSIAEKFFNGQ